MFGKHSDEEDFNAHGKGWNDVDLGPPNVNPEPHRPEAIIGQIPGWTNFDLEAKIPPKKRMWLYSKKSKIVVGVAIAAMLLVGILVPTVVAVRDKRHQQT